MPETLNNPTTLDLNNSENVNYDNFDSIVADNVFELAYGIRSRGYYENNF